jgi:hypothetical protein
MKRLIVVLLAAAPLISGCTRHGPDCRFLDAGYSSLRTDLSQLSVIAPNSVPLGVRRSIERCYPARPYDNYRGPFGFAGARQAASGHMYVIYEPLGITDVWLVFEVGHEGEPLKAFQYSTL